jgi:hypothetical protein
MNKRFAAAMAVYGVLLALAFLLLSDRRLLYAILILIGGLALKTLIALKRDS